MVSGETLLDKSSQEINSAEILKLLLLALIIEVCLYDCANVNHPNSGHKKWNLQGFEMLCSCSSLDCYENSPLPYQTTALVTLAFL